MRVLAEGRQYLTCLRYDREHNSNSKDRTSRDRMNTVYILVLYGFVHIMAAISSCSARIMVTRVVAFSIGSRSRIELTVGGLMGSEKCATLA
jgi:hypothetical protein